MEATPLYALEKTPLYALDGSPLHFPKENHHAAQERIKPTDHFVEHQGDDRLGIPAEASRRGVTLQRGQEQQEREGEYRLAVAITEEGHQEREEIDPRQGRAAPSPDDLPPEGILEPLEPEDLDAFFAGGATQTPTTGATKKPLSPHDQRLGSTWERGRKGKPEGYEDKIVSISHTHEAIMAYMIAFPHHGLREIGDHFGYSQTWLSQLINSDLFRGKFRDKQDEHFGRLSSTLIEKVEAVANVGIEKLGEMMERTQDPKFVKETTSDLLSKLGFGASRSPAGVSINAPGAQMLINTGDLAEARKLMRPANVLPLSSPEAKIANE